MNIKRLVYSFGSIILSLVLVSVLMLFLSGFARSAKAASYTVCASGCDYASIQAAVDAAGEGSTIKVAAGTYTGVYNRDGHTQVVYLYKSLTLRGGYTTSNWTESDPVANPTTIDAQGLGRVLYITGDIQPTIEGFYITGGEAEGLASPLGVDAGGGIMVVDAAPTIKNNTIIDNAANSQHNGDGGGVFLYHSAATLEANTIISNTAQRSGGGVYLYESPALILDNLISANNVPEFSGDGLFIQYSAAKLQGNTISNHSGNGIFTDFSLVILKQNTITGNLQNIFLWESDGSFLLENTISHGGHIDLGSGVWSGGEIGGDNITLLGNTISHNTADWFAGLDIVGENVRIIGNTIYSNTAVNAGGGGTIGGNVEFIGNTVISNTAWSGAGITLVETSGVQNIDSNYFANNFGEGDGGGISLGGGNPILTNNIFVDNRTDGAGSAIDISGGVTLTHMSHNTFVSNYGGDDSCIRIYGSTVYLTNTIFTRNTVGIHVHPDAEAHLETTLWGNLEWSNWIDWKDDGTFTHTNDLWGNPDFVDYENGDYHIGPSSDAIETGFDLGEKKDFDREPRPYLLPDIGADEYWPPGTLKKIFLPITVR